MENTFANLNKLNFGPDELRSKQFKKSMLGYSAQEVDEFLGLVAENWQKMLKHDKEHMEKIGQLTQEVTKFRRQEEEFQRSKTQHHAEVEASRAESKAQAQALLADAEQRAGEIKNRTEEWLEDVLLALEEVQKQKEQFVETFGQVLKQQQELLLAHTGSLQLGESLSKLLERNPRTETGPVSGNA